MPLFTVSLFKSITTWRRRSRIPGLPGGGYPRRGTTGQAFGKSRTTPLEQLLFMHCLSLLSIYCLLSFSSATLQHCCYCRKTYASIGCCEKKCRRSFHIACGLEHGVQTQFCRSYDSFCHEHVRYKFVPRLRSLVKGEFCCICYDPIVSGQDDGNELMAQYLYLRAPCCRNGWFHRNCLQKFAKTAGYFFKCPLCNDEKKFRCELTIRGIFIPNQ